MQTIDLEMTKELSDAFFNPRESSLFREPSCKNLLDYGSGRARAGFGATRGGPKKTEPKWGHRNGRPGHYGQRETSDVATRPLGHRQAPASSGNTLPEFDMSDVESSLPDRIEQCGRALTAADLAQLLAVSRITVFKLAKAGRIPSFRIRTCVRFDPKAVANWLRKM
jgi:excisionase family DNA binding protein